MEYAAPFPAEQPGTSSCVFCHLGTIGTEHLEYGAKLICFRKNDVLIR
jgi:hypothetical protein